MWSKNPPFLYTIVESCRRQGIDPLAYLRDVLTRLPKMLITEVAKYHAGGVGQGPAPTARPQGGIINCIA